MSDEQIIAYQGELQLLAWSESHNGGRKVTFQIPEDTDEHPFKHLTVRHGKIAGQRFMAVLVQIGDDEQPIPQEPAKTGRQAHEPKPAIPDAEKAGELARWAGILANDPVFPGWATAAYQDEWFDCCNGVPAEPNEQIAAKFIRRFCQVKSRRELDHDSDAARIFRSGIMSPFHAWKEANHA